MLNTMNVAPFDSEMLESCRLANERELKMAYLPSLADIELLKRQIRAENEARKNHPARDTGERVLKNNFVIEPGSDSGSRHMGNAG
jgi:hypothetical protein